MSSGSNAGNNPIVQAAITGLCAGLNAFLNPGTTLSDRKNVGDDPIDFDTVIAETETWTTNNFQNYFNYVFDSDGSEPPNALPNTSIVGFDEILVWGQTNYGDPVQIQAWINAQLADQVPLKLQPLLASELSAVINFAFQQGEEAWLPQNKTLIMPLKDGSATFYFDYVMLSSYCTDSDGNNPTGVARITGVLYYGPNNPTRHQ